MDFYPPFNILFEATSKTSKTCNRKFGLNFVDTELYRVVETKHFCSRVDSVKTNCP